MTIRGAHGRDGSTSGQSRLSAPAGTAMGRNSNRTIANILDRRTHTRKNSESSNTRSQPGSSSGPSTHSRCSFSRKQNFNVELLGCTFAGSRLSNGVMHRQQVRVRESQDRNQLVVAPRFPVVSLSVTISTL